MNWLFPAFLGGAFAVGLPILLHMLRRRPRRNVVFPSLRFIAATLQKTEKHHRIQRWLVLLMRCLALALLAAAFARPYFGTRGRASLRATVVVVDNTFSLQAKDRWPDLQSWATEQVGKLAVGDKLGVMVLAPRPTWIVAPTTDTASALAALRRLDPGWEAGRLEPALRLAADTLAATPANERKVIVLTDHQRVGWSGMDFSKKLPSGVTAIFPTVPKRLSRQAALLPPTLAPADKGVRATVSVQGFTSPHPRTLTVYRVGETRPVFETTIDVGERETKTVTCDLPASAEGTTAYRFKLDPDDLPADDTVYATWQTTGEHLVFLDRAPSASAADYVASALSSTATLKPTVRVLLLPASAWPQGAVAVLRGESAFADDAAKRLDTFLQNGGAALVFLDGNPAQRKWFAAHGAPLSIQNSDTGLHLRDWAMDHPIVSGLAEQRVAPLLGWDFRRGFGLPLAAVEPLALWTDSAAAIGELKVGAGRVLVCGFAADRRDSEWPLHGAFVPFIHRAVAYLIGAQAGVVTRPARVGEALALPAESGMWRPVEGPLMGRPERNVTGAVLPTAPGIYEFSSGTDKKLFAVNLTADESDPTPWTEGSLWSDLAATGPAPRDLTLPQVNLAAFEAEQRSPLWWGAIAAVVLLLLAELGLANRTMR